MQLLLIAAVCAVGCWAQVSSHTYTCLTDSTPDTAVRQYEVVRFTQGVPSCSDRLKYCNYALMFFTERDNPSSEALVLTADPQVCQKALGFISRALRSSRTQVAFSKVETACSHVQTRQVTSWIQKQYVFRGLVQCVDNLCRPAASLEFWQRDQRSYCLRYLRD